MPFKFSKPYQSRQKSLNVIPVIDILFQLIIFFSLVCQFVDTENFPVNVPDNCNFAQNQPQDNTDAVTVTVMKSGDDKIDYAVGPEKISASNNQDITKKLTELIDAQSKNLPREKKVVTLRIDKDVCFDNAQYALAAIAQSTVPDIRLAAIRDKRADTQ